MDEKLYFEVFNKITDMIEELKQLQCNMEDMYIATKEESKSLPCVNMGDFLIIFLSNQRSRRTCRLRVLFFVLCLQGLMHTAFLISDFALHSSGTHI